MNSCGALSLTFNSRFAHIVRCSSISSFFFEYFRLILPSKVNKSNSAERQDYQQWKKTIESNAHKSWTEWPKKNGVFERSSLSASTAWSFFLIAPFFIWFVAQLKNPSGRNCFRGRHSVTISHLATEDNRNEKKNGIKNEFAPTSLCNTVSRHKKKPNNKFNSALFRCRSRK